MAGRSDVKAFNINQGDSAAVLGPARSRIRQVVIFGNAAGVLTIKDGDGGADRAGSIGMKVRVGSLEPARVH